MDQGQRLPPLYSADHRPVPAGCVSDLRGGVSRVPAAGGGDVRATSLQRDAARGGRRRRQRSGALAGPSGGRGRRSARLGSRVTAGRGIRQVSVVYTLRFSDNAVRRDRCVSSVADFRPTVGAGSVRAPTRSSATLTRRVTTQPLAEIAAICAASNAALRHYRYPAVSGWS